MRNLYFLVFLFAFMINYQAYSNTSQQKEYQVLLIDNEGNEYSLNNFCYVQFEGGPIKHQFLCLVGSAKTRIEFSKINSLERIETSVPRENLFLLTTKLGEKMKIKAGWGKNKPMPFIGKTSIGTLEYDISKIKSIEFL